MKDEQTDINEFDPNEDYPTDLGEELLIDDELDEEFDEDDDEEDDETEDREREKKKEDKKEKKEEDSKKENEGEKSEEGSEGEGGEGAEGTEGAEAAEGAEGAEAAELAEGAEAIEGAEAVGAAVEGAEAAEAIAAVGEAAEAAGVVTEAVAAESNPVGWVITVIIVVILAVIFLLGFIFLIIAIISGLTGTSGSIGVGGGGGSGGGGASGGYGTPTNILEYCKYVGPISDTEAMRIYGSSAAEVRSHLVSTPFPQLGTITVHELAAPCFEAAGAEIAAKGIGGYRLINSGTFNWRCTMNKGTPPHCATSLSNHSFGIALDLNHRTNDVGMGHGDIPQVVVDAFKHYGFRWGGDYRTTSDPMHFEWLGRPNLALLTAPGSGTGSGATGLSSLVPPNYAALFTEAGKASGVPPALIAAIFLTEHGHSGRFGADLPSINYVMPASKCTENSSGAAGPMQFIPNSWAGVVDDLQRYGIASPDRCKYRDSIIGAGYLLAGKVRFKQVSSVCKRDASGKWIMTDTCVSAWGQAYCGLAGGTVAGGCSHKNCNRYCYWVVVMYKLVRPT